MIQYAFDFLGNNYPWILVVILACVIVCMTTIYIMKRLNAIKRVETDLAELKTSADCKLHHTAIGSTQDEVKSIREDIRTVLAGISNIKNAIVSIKPATASLFARSNSPLQLNDMGRKLFITSGADVILESNGSLWVEQLRDMKLKTALDVEEQSRLMLLALIDDDLFIPLKNYVYNHPTLDDAPVAMDDLCFVMGIELRNLYLAAYPDILQNM